MKINLNKRNGQHLKTKAHLEKTIKNYDSPLQQRLSCNEEQNFACYFH